MSEDFFQKQYFDQLTLQLQQVQKDVSEVKAKVNYMYGFAAAVGFIASFIFNYIKAKFFSSSQ